MNDLPTYKEMMKLLEVYEDEMTEMTGVNPNLVGKSFSLTSSSCSASSHSHSHLPIYEFIEAKEMTL